MTRLSPTTEHYDLHDEDGSHRSTCSTFDGTRIHQHEAAIRRHLLDHSPDCHPDCGPITRREDGKHVHENIDGRCWHEDGDDPC